MAAPLKSAVEYAIVHWTPEICAPAVESESGKVTVEPGAPEAEASEREAFCANAREQRDENRHTNSELVAKRMSGAPSADSCGYEQADLKLLTGYRPGSCGRRSRLPPKPNASEAPSAALRTTARS